jgi:UDP-glucose 4-epimerase
MNKCLITGVTGLIGSHLAEALDKDKWIVYGLSRGAMNKEIKNYQHLEIDLSKNWSTDLLPEKVDTVIHLAQSEYFRNFPEAVENIFHVNTSSTLRLLEYARKAGVKNFILASSGGVYGSGDKIFDEEEVIFPPKELGFYLSTKFCSELIAENYFSFFNIIIHRYFFVYGSGQRSDMLIPRLVNSVINGKPITLQGKEGLKINPVYVEDAVKAIIGSMALEKSEKINIAGSEVISIKDIAATIGKVVNKEPIYEIKSEQQPLNLIGDIKKLSKLLHVPEIMFEEGLRRYINSL